METEQGFVIVLLSFLVTISRIYSSIYHTRDLCRIKESQQYVRAIVVCNIQKNKYFPKKMCLYSTTWSSMWRDTSIESDPIFFWLVGRTSHQYKVGDTKMQEILQKSSKNSFVEIKVKKYTLFFFLIAYSESTQFFTYIHKFSPHQTQQCTSCIDFCCVVVSNEKGEVLLKKIII